MIDFQGIDSSLRNQEIEADKVGSGTADQLGDIRRRRQQVDQLRTATADPSWGNLWDAWSGAERDARFADIERQRSASEGANTVAAAGRGLLGSGVVAQSRGDMAADAADRRNSVATVLAEQRALAEAEREDQTRSILQEILMPTGLDDSIWTGRLNNYRAINSAQDLISNTQGQYRQALSDAIGGSFRSLGQFGAAGFDNATTNNQRQDLTGDRANSWFKW